MGYTQMIDYYKASSTLATIVMAYVTLHTKIALQNLACAL